MRRALFPVALAVASFAAWGAAAQNLVTKSLGACPDATPEEASLFKTVPVPEPRLETVGPIQLAGKNIELAAHSTAEFARIPGAWKTVTQQVQKKAVENVIDPQGFVEGNQAPAVPMFFACYTDGTKGHFNLMPAVPVQAFGFMPSDFSGITLEGHKYAVFDYRGTSDGVGDFRYSLTTQYWPKSSMTRADAPNIEVHLPDSDPPNAVHMEMWVAVNE